jgi:uncharacterized repeat protein (TIGR01451 family)
VTSVSDTCPDFTCTGGTKDNNRTTLTNTVGATVDLAIVKTAVDQNIATTTVNEFYQDSPAVYNITVTNNGPSNYMGSVIVNDDLSAITPTSPDPNFTYVSHSNTTTWSCTNLTTSSACASGAKNLRFTKTGGLLAGESSTIALTINVPDGVLGTKTNVATIDAATISAANDTVSGNNTESEVVEVLDNVTTLTLVKDDNDGTGEPTNADLQTKFFRGGIGKYTIVATNTGLSAAKAPVTISDTLPTGLTYADTSLTSNWDCRLSTSINVSCIYGNWNPTFTTFTQANMPVGTISGVEISVNVSSTATLSTLNTAPDPDVYNLGLTRNPASISGSNFPTVNAFEDTVIIEPADLAVTKAIAPSPLAASGTGTYTITVTNVSSVDNPASTGVSYPQIYLQDYLPTGLSYQGTPPATGTPLADGWVFIGYNSSANEVTYRRTTELANGASTNITLPVTVSASPPASVTNFVRVGGFTPEPDYDLATAGYQDPRLATCDASFGSSQPVNNCFALTTSITGGTSSDIRVIKKHPSTDNSNAVDAVAYNTSFPYTIEVTNTGLNTANNVSLSDLLPASLDYDVLLPVAVTGNPTITPNPYTLTGSLTRACGYDSLARRINCNLYTLTNGETVTITLNVKGLVTGIVPNTATVTTTSADPNLANNSESESVLVGAGGANTISGKVFNDLNDSGPSAPDSGENGTANVTVRLYQDNGTANGSFDAGDTLIASAITNATGDYSFTTSLTGNFVLNVDTSTLPSGHVLTATGSPTTFQPALLSSTVLTDADNNFGHRATIVPTDYGDAPDTGGGTGPNNYETLSGNGGASHTILATLRLGTNAPDSDSGALQNLAANDDDSNGTVDEDGITTVPALSANLPALTTSSTTYSVTVNVFNNTGSPKPLVGWIDFNKNGVFDVSEGQSASVGTNGSIQPVVLNWTGISGLTAGNTFARFRVSDGALTTSTPNGLVGNGEVEDYVVPINAVPKLNLVKRITAINGTPITGYIAGTPDLVAGNDATDLKWPGSANFTATPQYLRGAIACTNASGTDCNSIRGAKPGDLVEYTIYFLANGTDNLRNVKICDRIPTNTTFQTGTYDATLGSEKGILLGWDNTALPDPTTLTGTVALTNAIGDGPDKGNFVPAGTSLPNPPCGSDANTNGGVVVDVVSGPTTTVPIATGSGVPINSYGFVRFNVRVN